MHLGPYYEFDIQKAPKNASAAASSPHRWRSLDHRNRSWPRCRWGGYGVLAVVVIIFPCVSMPVLTFQHMHDTCGKIPPTHCRSLAHMWAVQAMDIWYNVWHMYIAANRVVFFGVKMLLWRGDLAKGIHVKLCQEAQERSEHAPQILCYRRLEDGGLTAVVSSLERQFVIRMVVELLSSAALWQAVFPQ